MKPRIWYCSDHHFYHELIWNSNRILEFRNVFEMNEELIYRHNQKVSNDDIIYFLGDVIFCRAENLDINMRETVGKMKGHKRLIIGNHDYTNLNKVCFTQYFEAIKEAEVIKDGNHSVHLFHYPILSWWNKQRDTYHVHGHLHGSRSIPEFDILRMEERALSACMEVNLFEPCTLAELIHNNERWKAFE